VLKPVVDAEVPPLEKIWVIIDLPSSNLKRHAKSAPRVNVNPGASEALAIVSMSFIEQR
jgi:hypothetical protein